MKVVTAEQMRALDRRAIEEFGVPGVVLMENAGRAVADVIAREYGPLQGKRIAVFCGSGNNGGDGFVIARYLHLAGAKIEVFLVDSQARKSDAHVHYELAARLAIPFQTIPENMDPKERRVYAPVDVLPGYRPLARPITGYPSAIDELQAAASESDLIIDALLGTGIKAAPRQPYAGAIQAIRAAGRPVIAVDVPSGVDSDTGATPGEAVRATHTVTFAYPKLGLFLFPGAECVGKLHLASIGFDWDRLEPDTPFRLFAPTAAGAGVDVGDFSSAGANESTGTGWERLLGPRPADSNKGDFGHVAIAAGSRGMAGAPSLVARAAQRVGAGLVTVLAPACVQPTIAGKLNEEMTLPLPDADGVVSEAAFDTIAKFAAKATVICVGPGLTTEPGAVALVQRIIAEIDMPLVLDADGLNALAQRPDVIANRPRNIRAPLILTPHPGEAARLLNRSISEVQSDRVGAVRELARRFGAVALLKGRHTLIADPDGNVTINTTGNPGMASGGMGDTLTGILGGLLAQAVAPGRQAPDDDAYRAATVSPYDVVGLGVYLHGLAGDLAAGDMGQAGLAAGDLIPRLPAALRMLKEPL